VFGGSLAGWQSLLMTHGCSALAAAPLLVIDLAGEGLCGELAGTARAAGVPAAEWLLPADLGDSGLLAGLSGAQLADALVEAVHAGEPGAAGGPLTGAEQALIAGELFPAEYRRQVEPNLVRVEAFLADLARHDTDPAGPAAGVPDLRRAGVRGAQRPR
jgi:hypothetical protein